MKRGICAILLLPMFLYLPGCGGGDDEPEPLSKAEFSKQADAACKKANQEKAAGLQKAFKEFDPSKTSLTEAEKEDLLANVVLPPVEKMNETLGELGAPDDEAEAVVEGFEALVEEVEDDPSATLEDGGDPFDEVNELSAKYGLESCAAL